jgi:hypothetical protein
MTKFKTGNEVEIKAIGKVSSVNGDGSVNSVTVNGQVYYALVERAEIKLVKRPFEIGEVYRDDKGVIWLFKNRMPLGWEKVNRPYMNHPDQPDESTLVRLVPEDA